MGDAPHPVAKRPFPSPGRLSGTRTAATCTGHPGANGGIAIGDGIKSRCKEMSASKSCALVSTGFPPLNPKTNAMPRPIETTLLGRRLKWGHRMGLVELLVDDILTSVS